ncbi:uncharacterized protein LOC126571403 [Anopheles aquasalis]|uniref:uncharacterized protein LOC126571403 n=1 Tax=Anopheles aquasalis TaxID=42839 RepID=UPI00215AAC45|nr:uncharacterized protein LOC126571403 [Anopheles aquasalis]
MWTWQRPDTIPYPSVWHRFSARAPDSNDQLVSYVVQDVPEDRFEECIDHMCSYFIRDEPICRAIRLTSDPVGIREFSNLWRQVLLQHCAVVCLREDTGELVGANILTVVSRTDGKSALPIHSAGVRKMIDCTLYLTEQAKLFERYPIECFLSAWGLSVHPRYRGLGLAKEILYARIPLCKTLGLKLSATVFSHPGSQIPASKVGFRDAAVEKYEDLEKKGFAFPDISVEYNKLMVLLIE